MIKLYAKKRLEFNIRLLINQKFCSQVFVLSIYLSHSLYFLKDNSVAKRAVNFSPKTIDAFKPKARVY